MTRPPEFKILIEEDAGTVRVAPQGELDLATAPELQAELDRIVALEGLQRVIVDDPGDLS
jgi:anti-anti-sigma regulatory factor